MGKKIKVRFLLYLLMSEEDKIDPSELSDAKSGLASAEKIEHEQLKPTLKCSEGHATEIPADLQAKMDKDEDLGSLPSCATCGIATSISVTGA